MPPTQAARFARCTRQARARGEVSAGCPRRAGPLGQEPRAEVPSAPAGAARPRPGRRRPATAAPGPTSGPRRTDGPAGPSPAETARRASGPALGRGVAHGADGVEPAERGRGQAPRGPGGDRHLCSDRGDGREDRPGRRPGQGEGDRAGEPAAPAATRARPLSILNVDHGARTDTSAAAASPAYCPTTPPAASSVRPTSSSARVCRTTSRIASSPTIAVPRPVILTIAPAPSEVTS